MIPPQEIPREKKTWLAAFRHTWPANRVMNQIQDLSFLISSFPLSPQPGNLPACSKCQRWAPRGSGYRWQLREGLPTWPTGSIRSSKGRWQWNRPPWGKGLCMGKARWNWLKLFKLKPCHCSLFLWPSTPAPASRTRKSRRPDPACVKLRWTKYFPR